MPIALVSLVDAQRQWFKSRQGLAASETSREISFCGHAILGDALLVVEDARKDKRFADNPLVVGEPGIRFYAGYPVGAADGSKLGTLCIIGHEPRSLVADERALLHSLATMIEAELGPIDRAVNDVTTGLANLRGFLEIGDFLLRLSGKLPHPPRLIVFDIAIDAGGGLAKAPRVADSALLVGITRVLLAIFGSCDLVARIGPRTFAVIDSDGGNSKANAEACYEERVRCLNLEVATLGQVSIDWAAVDYAPSRHLSTEEMLSEAEHSVKKRRLLRADRRG